MRSKAKRVLLYRLGSMGDMIVALPAFHLAARAFPDAERRLLTNVPVNRKAAAAASILDAPDGGSGLVSGYFSYVVGLRNPLALAKLWWQLRRWRPEVLVYLGSARGVASAERDRRFFRACGIREQIGVPLTAAMQQNLPQPEHGGALEPEFERLVRNLDALGDAELTSPAAWDLGFTAGEQARAAAAAGPAGGRPLLAVCVGTKVQAKDWGEPNWRALLEVLGGELEDFALALVGAPEESATSGVAASGWRASAGAESPVLNLCGALTPRESAAFLAHARLFVGHDSGPMHLAATVGTPCVAIFAARNIPRVWFPHGPAHRIVYHPVDCMGCGLETCIVERKRCLTSITVEEVASAVRAALRGQRPEPFNVISE